MILFRVEIDLLAPGAPKKSTRVFAKDKRDAFRRAVRKLFSKQHFYYHSGYGMDGTTAVGTIYEARSTATRTETVMVHKKVHLTAETVSRGAPKMAAKSTLPERCTVRDGLCLCQGGRHVMCLAGRERDQGDREALQSLARAMKGPKK